MKASHDLGRAALPRRPLAVSAESERKRRVALASVWGLGVSSVMTQLALMREMLSAFSGNEMVLGIILGKLASVESRLHR